MPQPDALTADRGSRPGDAELPGHVLVVAAALWLVAYALPVLAPGLPPAARTACALVSVAVWVLFGVDYAWRLFRAPHRLRFAWTHPLDLALLVLPALGPLRLLRVLTVLRILNRSSGASLRGRVGLYVGSATVLVGFCAALAVLDAERGAPGANITTFADASWWVVTTITTVGYGDFHPVTSTGRLVAVGLMLAGIALLGIVTASLASWLIDRVSDGQQESAAATRADVEALAREVRQLRAELRARDASAGSAPPAPDE
ncbi:potassium channel family protein [Kineococcus sp. TBRC 1896]|uniref:Potassium channel family protein n=1 Tax=Kineococcus mangrovi TaxID=1660183 RepID=A0ABV4HZT7_9ACTN